jgi:hypothetical protein
LRYTVFRFPFESSLNKTPCSTQRFSIFDAFNVSTEAIRHKSLFAKDQLRSAKWLNCSQIDGISSFMFTTRCAATHP